MNRSSYVAVLGAAILALLVAGCGKSATQPAKLSASTTSTSAPAPSSTSSNRTSTKKSAKSSAPTSRSTPTTPKSSGSSTNWDAYIQGEWLMKESGLPGETYYSFNTKLGTMTSQYWARGYKINDPLDNGVAAPLLSNNYTVRGTTINIGVLGTHSFTDLAKSGSNCFTARRDGNTAVKFCRM